MSNTSQTNDSWLNDLPDEVAEVISRKQLREQFKPGEFLYRQNEPMNAVYQIVAGRAEVCYVDAGGEQFTIALVENGDTCGEGPIISNLGATYGCIARTACDVNLLPREDFLQIIKDFPEVSTKITVRVAMLLRYCMQRSTIASQSLVRDRLIWLLLWAKDYYGKKISENQFVLQNIRLTDLYRMLGTARQTLSREFQYLAAENIVKQDGSNIVIIDAQKLREASSEKVLCFNDIEGQTR